MIKAIETVYRGFRFRSRLEARWAVFFDAMDETWEYEKEGYDLNGIYYLPDFYLPRLKCFVEIKGKVPTFEEFHKCSMFRDYVGKAIVLFHGLPTEYYGMLFCWDEKDDSLGSSDWEVCLCDNDGGVLNFCVEDVVNRRNFYMDELFTDRVELVLNYPNDGETVGSLIAAKQARFEHGETPYKKARIEKREHKFIPPLRE